MAPEVLTGTSNELSDIWSIGCLTYMMLSGFMPFDSKSEASVVRKIQKGDYHFKQAVWETIGQDAKDFIGACLKVLVRKKKGYMKGTLLVARERETKGEVFWGENLSPASIHL